MYPFQYGSTLHITLGSFIREIEFTCRLGDIRLTVTDDANTNVANYEQQNNCLVEFPYCLYCIFLSSTIIADFVELKLN